MLYRVSNTSCGQICFNLNSTPITLKTFKDTCPICLSHFKVEAKTNPRKLNWDTLSILALFNFRVE